jgi:hypothetical protein
LPADWNEVLTHVHQALREAVAASEERQRALESLLEVPSTPGQETVWRQTLEQLDQRVRGLQEFLAQAERQTAEADTVLNTGEDQFQRWLETVGSVRRRLADWSGRAIG